MLPACVPAIASKNNKTDNKQKWIEMKNMKNFNKEKINSLHYQKQVEPKQCEQNSPKF